MPEKTYKFVSVCERGKPIQTNNPSTFTSHVAACPICQAKLPKSIIEELEPRLSQLVAERAKTQPPPEKEVPPEPAPATPSLQEQFESHVKDSPIFQGLAKSVADTQGNVKKLTERFDGFDKSISSQFTSLGKELMAKITGQPPPEEVVEETGKERLAEPGPSDTGETRGKLLSEEQERLHEEGGDLAGGAGQRPSPFGAPDVIPAANRPGYKGGETPPKETPPPKEISPPETGVPRQETPKTEESPIVEKPKGVPDLTGPSEIEAVEAWLTEQKRKQGVGAEEKPKKKGGIPYIGDLKDVIREGRELVDAWRGKGEGEGPPLSGDISQAISFAKTMNEFSTSQLKNVFEMIRALREAEKLIYVPVSGGGVRTPSPPEATPPESEHIAR